MLTMRITPKIRLRPAAIRKRTEAYSNEFSIWIARIDNAGPLSKPATPRLHAAARGGLPRSTTATVGRKTHRARSSRARWFKVRSSAGLRPGGLDPVGGRGRFVVAVAGLRPVRGRGDVADRDGDDLLRIPDRERIVRHVLAEPGHRVLV